MAERELVALRRRLVAVLTFVIAGALLISGLIALRLRQEALTAANQMAAMHSRAFEDHLTTSLQAVDITIKGIAAAPIPPQTLFGVLRNVPHLRSVSLLGARDATIAASTNPANAGLRIDTRAFFPDAAASDQWRIGAPVTARDFADPPGGPGPGFVPLLRSVAGAAGRTDVLVALNSEYFLTHFGRALEDQGGQVRVLRYDGMPLFSTGGLAWPDFAARLEEREFGLFEHVAPDGAHYITAYKASRLYPLVVAVRFERGRVLEVWSREMRVGALVVAGLLAATVLLALVVYRRQAQLRQRDVESARERRLAASVFDASSNAIVLTDAAGIIIAVNPAFERLNGYAAAEVLGRNPRVVSSGRQDRGFYTAMWRAIETAGFWRGELVNRRRDGSEYDALLSITAVRDGDGTLLHYAGICADISETKRHERELTEARDRAEAGSRTKAAFLATMSHEIRTPMNGILGMTQLALMGPLPDKERRYLEIARSSAESLLTILNDLLDFSKAEAGHLRLESRAFDPAVMVGEVADLFAARAAEKGIELRRAIPAGLPARIHTDEVRLRQILTNLLSNAIKFTEHGHAAIGLAVQDEGRTLAFHVEDTGIGIPPDMHARIFAPFVQADDTVTRRFGGTGLGLAICHQLAELMGGTLAFESRPGAGTRFEFRLPLQGARAAETPAAPGDARKATAPLDILVAEDVPANQALIVAMLEDDGHRLTLVDDGAGAVAQARARRFDLILMDLQMPELDGLGATRRIRADEAAAGRARVPVIALTASVFPIDRKLCVEAGMDDFVPKPIELDALREAMRRALAAAPRGARQQARAGD